MNVNKTLIQKHLTGYLIAVLFMAGLISCAQISSSDEGVPLAEAGTLTIMTHDSFSVSEEIVKRFEKENNVKVKFLKSGDTGTALNKAILSKGNPLADVFYGVDNTFLSRALEEDIFDVYNSEILDKIDSSFILDPENRALPVDFGDVCLNYDKTFFEEEGLNPPETFDDLLKPEYKSLLVVQNPATSSPGLAFLFATIANYGATGYLEFWSDLVENDVLIVNDWETAYYSEFSGSSGRGPRPIVVSYDSSPAFEVLYAETPIEEPPTAAIVSKNTCFRQVEFVGILKGGQNRDLAEKWIDYMLSPFYQEDIPLQMFVFPVNPDAQLEEIFLDHLILPEELAFISPAEIAANREKWIREWTEAILR
jgi:thiamine transport system substrate-binding protein